MLEMFSQQGEMVEFERPVEAKGAHPQLPSVSHETKGSWPGSAGGRAYCASSA